MGGSPATIEQIPVSDLPTESGHKRSPGACELKIKVSHSTVNYKDALVSTGKYPGLIIPMVGGCDLSGKVVEDTSGKFKEGDSVLVNGWGIGTDHFGGYAEYASLRSLWAMKVPEGLNELNAAQIGTGGYTGMLCVDALVERGVKPEDGPVLVTGSTGGVGSVSVAILSELGYEVTAVTGKTGDAETEEWLRSIGAAKIVARSDFEDKPKPLGKEIWAGVIDTVGGNVLANALSQIKYNGAAAACGLAGGMGLPTTVAPFILRAVDLIGVESAFKAQAARDKVYSAYGPGLISSGKLAKICKGDEQVIGLEKVVEVSEKMLEGKITGRYIVKPE